MRLRALCGSSWHVSIVSTYDSPTLFLFLMSKGASSTLAFCCEAAKVEYGSPGRSARELQSLPFLEILSGRV